VASELPIPAQGTRQRLEALGLSFLDEILRRELLRYPENLDALAERAQVLTRQGRHREGLALDRRLVRLVPEDPTARYNLACSLALLGEVEQALDHLEQAVELGYRDGPFLAADEDLAGLRDEPRFQALLESLHAR
jgi:tetratricopeptide (TPR) repeat protein